MRYGLCDDLSFCWTQGRAVFLDIRRDRYFCLSGRAEAAFKAIIEANGTPEVQDLDHLVQLGVAAPLVGCAPIKPAAAPTPNTSLVDQPSEPVSLDPLTVAEIIWRLAWARLQLKRRTLKALLTALKNAQVSATPDITTSEGRCADLARQFNAVRRRTPLAPACLPDALALLDFLRVRRLHPSLIFGVRLDPFAAHCWVQADALVLNDLLDHVLAFAPILTV